MKFRPMSNAPFLVSIVGLIVVGYLTLYETLSPRYGFALMLLAIIVLIASIVSLTPSDN